MNEEASHELQAMRLQYPVPQSLRPLRNSRVAAVEDALMQLA
jgi:hypothetical protein